ncbi:methyltransferase domain-containing protein [Streptomyces sp. NPDC058953]|uniref:methyltransferase domain-containing protein n=1 Tax=unclassified Streptomyces TaxID=2593676 RepID=UPI003676FC16
MTVTDVAEYDAWSSLWWRRRGPFSTLRWLARARASHVPPARRDDAVLVDVGCGGGLLHPFVADRGYRHIGIDMSTKSAEVATRHGVDEVLIADISAPLPLPDASADVVTAGCCLEHVPNPEDVIAECCRVLRPGGTLIMDTIADTLLARLSVITFGENVPLMFAAPKGTHDHRLFISPSRVVTACAENGVPVTPFGLVPKAGQLTAWVAGRWSGDVGIRRVRSTSVIYGVVGVKSPVGSTPDSTDSTGSSRTGGRADWPVQRAR